MNITMVDTESGPMMDITEPDRGVEVDFDVWVDGDKLWVNVDGVCRLRISRIQLLEVNDRRDQHKSHHGIASMQENEE